MPELPDITVYIEALEQRVRGETLARIRLGSPFLLRTVEPAPDEVLGKRVLGLRRLGKRIVFELENELFLVLHLMIAGRLHWEAAGHASKRALAIFDFSSGSLLLTEAGSKKRASLHIVRGEKELQPFNPGGLEVLEASLEQFRKSLTRESHTVKRALTDPHLFSGIGNAYSDEILHAARLSPLKLSRTLAPEESARLHQATRETLSAWIDRLRDEARGSVPEKVTAFHAGMAVHGRFGQPCPACGAPVQRIVYAANECNYCARCQTGGRLLADRSLSRLLRDDWPRSIDEVE